MATHDTPPTEVLPAPSQRKYWTRKGIANWLVALLEEAHLSLIGIDHGFSFPLRYFETYHIPPDWQTFLDDFQAHWPTDEDHVYVDFVRDGSAGDGASRFGRTRWKRITEERSGSAKSVFHFDVPGSVAKSTHSGIPWLRFIRQQVGARVHFWPFDGWEVPTGKSVVVEAYPSLWRHDYTKEGRTQDQHDAYCVAAWMRDADANGTLADFFNPPLRYDEKMVGQVEGWILGVK